MPTKQPEDNFWKWFIKTYSTKTYFMRVLTMLIVGAVLILVACRYIVPNELWMLAGSAIGYYFKSHADD
jgi:hypothetical protein